MNIRLQRKILTSIRKDEDSNCWLWTGQISNSGYGKVMLSDDNHQTHMESADHVSFMAFIGPIPKGLLTRQTCHNRLCVNPQHLELFNPEAWRESQPVTD